MAAKYFSAFILLCLISIKSFAIDSLQTFVNIDTLLLERGIGCLLSENWKYMPGDDTTWADHNLDDSSWETITSTELKENYPSSGFTGNGWFRIHLRIDSSLINYPLGFSILQTGASEIYLNGELIEKFGVVGNVETEVLRSDGLPYPIKFNNGIDHVIAIRYSNHKYKFFNDAGFRAGFRIVLDDLFDL